MARPLTSALHVARHLMASDAAWLLFVEVESRSQPGKFFRLVSNTRNMTAAGRNWQATTMKIELPEETGEGQLAQLRIAVPNVSRLPIAYVEAEDDLIDQPVTVWLANTALLDEDEFNAAASWTHQVVEVVIDAVTAVFTCGHPAGVMLAPGPVYDRTSYPQLLPSAGQGVVGSGY